MKIDRIVTIEENGLCLAEKNYPAALQSLWSDYVQDPAALDRFVASRKDKGPVIEEIKDEAKDVNVIYFYYGDENTESVQVFTHPTTQATDRSWLFGDKATIRTVNHSPTSQ